MSEYRQKLQTLLRELFQFDSADLDFGIYAVMNHKREEVERFIELDLLDAIAQGLQLQSDAQQVKAREEFDQARQKLQAEYGDEAFDAQGNLTSSILAMPGQTAKHLREAYLSAHKALEASVLSGELEGQTYNDLYRFFARYYDDGDFISQRRYGQGNKYAIPYNGEEVFLYWANFDQYYVKTGETFADYRFTVEPALGFDAATVHFKLRQASVEQNNVKGDKRFFVLAVGDEVQWDATNRTLTIGFEYRPLAADEQLRAGSRDQQDKLNAEAAAAVLRTVAEPLLKERIGKVQGEPGKEKSLLAKHLARYTTRNTRDYFIHKDLGSFLRRELDFFLKNEVLHLEDLDWNQPSLVQATAARLQTLRLIAGKIVDFLAQIEEFQKRLWEKRKFVVQSDYCVTLDRVPETLYGEIAASDRQRAEWQKLYGVALGPDADLQQHSFLMVDTAFFDDDFKARLLAHFDDLDKACDGLLVHGENYQALRLLTPRYREQVKCIYIDPPYNTGNDGFAYKDSFQHSSWAAMMTDRLAVSQGMLSEQGVTFVSIDDHEDYNLRHVMSKVFEPENYIAQLVWEKGRKNDARLFSVGHEYMTVFARSLETLRALGTVWREPKPGAQEIWETYLRLRKQNGEDDESVETALQTWYRELPKGHASKALSRYKHVDKYGPWRDRDISWPGGGGPRYDVIHPETKEPCKVPERGWGFANPDAMQKQIRLGLVVFREDHTQPPFRKAHLYPISEELDDYNLLTGSEDGEEDTVVGIQVMSSVLYKQSQVAVKYLRNLMGAKVFDNPKDHEVLARIIGYCTSQPDTVVDYFAGSGTMAHSVIEANRRDAGKRKYVLVEMADYFDTVIKPRIQKVAYAADWRDGKPVPDSPGQSHMFQTIRLESYEDALNNLRFRVLGDEAQAALYALPDYFLRYMLDFETRGSPSLLDTEQFDKPFQYQLAITRQQETRPRTVDLVTTFNFLLGLRVRTVRTFQRLVQTSDFSEEIGGRAVPVPVVRVLGEDGAGRRVCVLWRDAPSLEEMEAEKQWLQAKVLVDVAYDLLYINGESALPDALPIEPEFKRLMFS